MAQSTARTAAAFMYAGMMELPRWLESYVYILHARARASSSQLLTATFLLSHFEPLPFRGMSLWSQAIYPSLPRFTPCMLVSRIRSALPHRVNSQQTNSVDYFVYSRSHAFHDGIKHYEEKIPTQLESNPRISHVEADVGPLHHRVAAACRSVKFS